MKTPTQELDTGLVQEYDKYTQEDQTVWTTLFTRQIVSLPDTATSEYLAGIERINFTANSIPNFEATNEKLKEITGWELVAVPGIVDDELFFNLLVNKKFPATTWLRKMSEIDYLEEPDMFHDVFGHVPILTNHSFSDFLVELGKVGLEYIGNDQAIHLLSRIYWFTVEFGLIKEKDELKIYGAGILSSAGETKYSLSSRPEHFDYNVEDILDSTYRKDAFQTKYFIIHSYKELYDSINDIKEGIKKRI
ncbi:MAG: phenylalanine 4-monooxygenase [Bacteroidota bacterium]